MHSVRQEFRSLRRKRTTAPIAQGETDNHPVSASHRLTSWGGASFLALRQGFLVGLPAGWACADVPGVGCSTSYESH